MISRVDMFFFFFFQAEDGIRDYKVTGVQTCALPICSFPQVGRGDLGKGAVPRHQGLSRLYLRRISRNRSCGRAYTVTSSAPVIVWAASIALMIASSVAWTVASNRGVIWSLEIMATCASPESRDARWFAVENAMKMSPDELPASPPMRPTPRAARFATRFS